MYIGKASNLKNRLKQYSNKKTESPFLEHLLNEAEILETKTTDSEIEALILESKLIKEKKPKYNIMLRDDKQYFYVGFTKEEFPKILITHGPKAIKRGVARVGAPHRAQIAIEHYGGDERQDPEAPGFIGPFTDGVALKTTLRLLRRIFPYCTCKQKHNNFCLNYHIEKCLGFCCLKQPEANPNFKFSILNEYKKNIKTIKGILYGKKSSVIKNLKKDLKELGRLGKFEEAIKLRDKIEKLEKVFENAKIIQDTSYKIPNTKNILEKLAEIFKLSRTPSRIEAYDISNIQGKNATGAMAVFIKASDPEEKPSASYGASKNEYRKFKIIFKNTPDDIAMLKETLIRRFKHPEWQFPDLIFIDGGIAQLNVAKKAASATPIISLAKGRQEVFSTTLKKPLLMKDLSVEIQNFIRFIDSEAHRSAIAYYRKIHRKAAFK